MFKFQKERRLWILEFVIYLEIVIWNFNLNTTMPMFWSKKSKSEKNYEQASSSKGSSAKGAVAKPAYKGARQKKAAPMFAGMQAAKGVEQTNKAVAAPKIVSRAALLNAASVIIRPHITEKSGLLSQSGVYTFQISENATKSSVAKAMAALYKVTPIRVAMINLPDKKVFVRGKRGVVSGIRKAMVTVKEGEKIDFV
jgi:large subunit ribosomal protein L23